MQFENKCNLWKNMELMKNALLFWLKSNSKKDEPE